MSAIGLPRALERTPRVRALGAAPRWTVRALLWTVLGFAMGLCMTITVPYLFGYKSLTVMSGSMVPTLGVGDVVVVREIEPLDARIGDVITFRDPTDDSRLLTHRVRSIEVHGTKVTFETKGDANTSIETWDTSVDGKLGHVEYRVPKIGYALFWIRGRYGRLLLVVLPALLLGAYELWRIWRPERTNVEEVEDGAQA